MSRHPKPGYLGPAFHHYLEYLETVENAIVHRKAPKKSMAITMNNRLWNVDSDEAFYKVMADAMPVDAVLAPIVRSSVKYKVNVTTLVKLADLYPNELLHIGNTVPMRLPHQWCTTIIEGFGSDDMILVSQEQTTEKDYDELGIKAGDDFICVNIGAFRRDGVELEDGTIAPAHKLSYFPAEIHMRRDQTERENQVLYAHAGDGAVQPTQEGHKVMDLLCRTFYVWHHQFHLQSVLRNKQVAGVKAQPGNVFQRRRLRKRTEHPQFEHTIIQLEIDAPESSQTGRSVFQPRKRMHQVRGFWRQYRKTGKKVWVKPHWRGDEKLGVVKRDFELITHEEGIQCH